MSDLHGTAVHALLEAEGRELCERCHCCEVVYEDCEECGGDGWVSRHDEDHMWYDEDDLYRCEWCLGKGHWRGCLGRCDEHGAHGKAN